jgi:hypothetical protein
MREPGNSRISSYLDNASSSRGHSFAAYFDDRPSGQRAAPHVADGLVDFGQRVALANERIQLQLARVGEADVVGNIVFRPASRSTSKQRSYCGSRVSSKDSSPFR